MKKNENRIRLIDGWFQEGLRIHNEKMRLEKIEEINNFKFLKK